ncbi:MAG: chemotaxis protein CheW [Candidatus Riflebacteria bacterium]|nr:chemotaxis protein CheW [Candidatus Riflebacteria bacterium]
MEPQVQECLKLIATFFINDCLYGIDTQRLQEVVRISEITPVHHSPEYVLGVMNLRGRIVTVIDLGCKLLLKKLTVANYFQTLLFYASLYLSSEKI